MEDNKNVKCSGDCLMCNPAQRTYCASQHAYSNMKVLDNMMVVVLTLQDDVKRLSEKIEAMQNNEASVFGLHDVEEESAVTEAAQENRLL